MSLTIAIVGMPNVGKTTFFNALTKMEALIANYPFATIEPNVAHVNIPDPRLIFLNKLYQSKKIRYAALKFFDIAGLIKGASKGEGLGNQFLANIRRTDLLCIIVRCFTNKQIIHVNKTIDPILDFETVLLELVFSDYDNIKKQLQKQVKKPLPQPNEEQKFKLLVMNRVLLCLKQNMPLYKINWEIEEINFIRKELNLLTIKPILIIANISGDNNIDDQQNVYLKQLKQYCQQYNYPLEVIDIHWEYELGLLSFSEQQELLNVDNKNNDLVLHRIIIKCFHILELNLFYTVGKDEAKAWLFLKNSSARDCAGLIHSDFKKGFIRAEVFTYNDIKRYHSESKLRQLGKIQSEGRRYLVKDGDICFFRFNV